MKPTALLAAACLVLTITSSTTASALAQAPQTDRQGRGEHWRQHREQHRQEMMTDLHTILRIRPEQETAFQAFAAMAPHEGREHVGEMAGVDALTTPQLIDQMDARKAAHDAEERQRGAAVKRFYAALSPEQQQVFDALRRLTMGQGGWGGRMHGPPHGPMGRGMGGPGGPPPAG